MRIRTKLELMAILPGLVSIAVCAVLYMVYGNVDRLSRSASQLNMMVRDVFELSTISHQYLRDPSPEHGTRWNHHYQMLGRSLATVEALETAPILWANLSSVDTERIMSDRGLHEKIRKSYESLFLTFREIELAAQAGGPIANNTGTRNLETSLHLLSGDILTLASITQAGSASIQTTGYMIIVFICVLLSLVVLAISIPFGISLSNQTRGLLEAIHAMSRGQTDQTLSVNLNDELGDIARAFTAMRKQVFDSQQALTSQLDEHRKTASSLQTTNSQLSDVLSRLERAKNQAIQQERLQAIHQLAYGVVHDLNSALTPIIGMTEFLKMDQALAKDKPELAEALDMIHQSADNCRRVVMNLVELVHPLKPEATEEVDLNVVLRETVDITRPRWKSQAELTNIQIDTRINFSPVPVMVDSKKSELEECLANLIFNAIDAMPAGGTISLSCHVMDGQAIMTISDTGTGMTAEARARCFEPFFSTKTKESSGMGLTTTRTVIARYRGTVELISEESKGTTITIRLPISYHSEQVVAPAPLISTPRILVVDDEDWAIRILQKHLSLLDCEVCTSLNAQEALALFKPHAFEAVFLDRAMPGMNGDGLAKQLKQIQPELMVVMVTGFADLMQEQGQTSPHVDIVLAKPFTQRDLTDVIQRCRNLGWKSPHKQISS